MPEENPPYKTEPINAAIGAKRWTNFIVGQKAGVSAKTVSAVRNGDPNVGYVTLKRVVEAVGLTMADVAETETESAAA